MMRGNIPPLGEALIAGAVMLASIAWAALMMPKQKYDAWRKRQLDRLSGGARPDEASDGDGGRGT